jgi:bifunctional NMN adenylyltransferase/nudix hydrolase
MKETANIADVGVIVGRFQVNELHEAHIELIQKVKNDHDRVIIFLGLSSVRNTRNNPLDFKPRQAMLREAFPDVEVFYVDDCASDDVWSKNLDGQINKWLQPSQTVILYGSRDSFISHYKGKFRTITLESKTYVSGTDIRKKIINQSAATPDFRAGMIYASGCRYPTFFTTVDVFVMDTNEGQRRVLLGRKPNETKFRAIGGFTDPTKDESLEAAAARELAEETGNGISHGGYNSFQYIGSTKVDDWRYRREVDQIITTVFKVEKLSGAPSPSDDIAEVRWFTTLEIFDDYKSLVVSEHHPLIRMLGISEGQTFDTMGERMGVKGKLSDGKVTTVGAK